MKRTLAITVFSLGALITKSQLKDELIVIPLENTKEINATSAQLHKSNTGRVNFFVFTKEKSKKVDLISFYTLMRATIRSFLHHRKFYVIKAASSADAAMKIEFVLRTRKKLIKNIWFDSHGHYGNRYSSFRIGADQFSYKNINDSNSIKNLQGIALYCDEQTNIGLGSCYAGADFYFPSTDSTPACRMNGDSLMIGMGNIFTRSSIFASESWVMSKPGIFKNRFGFAGYPLNKRFKDNIYAPVWERIGKWKQYSLLTRELQSIPTIALDKCGNISPNKAYYNDFKKAKNKIAKVLKQLRPGLARFS
ncbi:MAG: hypothetical protein ABI760_05920 [Ferruginibacter sp.]